MQIIATYRITLPDNENTAPATGNVISLPERTFTATLTGDQHRMWLEALLDPDTFNADRKDDA